MSDLLKDWDLCQGYLRNKIEQSQFYTWILPLKPKSTGEEDMILQAPDQFFRDWVEKNYGALIQDSFKACCAHRINVSLEVDTNKVTESEVAMPTKAATKQSGQAGGLNLNPRYTF